MLFKNLTLADRTTADMLVENGRIVSIGPAGTLAAEGHDAFDGAGYVVLPGLVDSHIHLDKTLLGMDWFTNELGPMIGDRIDNERNTRGARGLDVFRQASRLAELCASMGTLHFRSHIDIDTDNGLKGVEDMLRVRDAYKDVLTIQLVAFPQSGLVNRPGTIELMEQALGMGVDVVGGIDPAVLDRDPVKSIDAIFSLAEKHQKPIDIHLHEMGELGGFSIELIAARTKAAGMQGKVTISHGLCLGNPNQALVAPLIEKLADAEIAVTTGGQAYVASVAPVRPLMAAGVNITGGNDDVRDMWSHYGTGDLFERVQFIAMRNMFRRDDDIEMTMQLCTDNGAKLLGLADYGLKAGADASFVLARGRNLCECIVSCPRDRIVYSRGKKIAEGINYIA